MGKIIVYVLELIGLGGLLVFITFIKWTNVALGAILSIAGAFFPQIRGLRTDSGEGSTTFGGVSVVVRGGARFAVVVAGIVLIVGGIVQGFTNYHEQKASELLDREKKDKTCLDTAQQHVESLQRLRDPQLAQSEIEKVRKLIETSRSSCEENIKVLDQAIQAPSPSKQPSP